MKLKSSLSSEQLLKLLTRFVSMGGTIEAQPNGDVVLSMKRFLKSMGLITLSRERRRLLHAKATMAGTKAFPRRCGKFCQLGMMAFPYGHFYAFYLQQSVRDLRVYHCNLYFVLVQTAALSGVPLAGLGQEGQFDLC
jgi:hypothetical protein